MDRVRVAHLGLGRHHHHPDGAVSVVSLVPGDEDRASALVLRRSHDDRQVDAEPRISGGYGAVVHVVAQVWRDEVVPRNGPARDVARELRVGPHMLKTAW